MKYQSATLIKYPNKIVIHGSSISDVGLGLANTNNAKVFDFTEISDNIIEEIKNILNEKESVVKHPTDWKDQTTSYYNALGFQNNKQYMKNAKMIIIMRRDDDIIINPMKNNGTKGENKGFYPIEEKKIVVKYNENTKSVKDAIDIALMNAEISV